MTPIYPRHIRVVHWATVVLVLLQIISVLLHQLVYETNPRLSEWLVQQHISLGAVVFLATLLRLALRQVFEMPLGSSRTSVRVAARINHAAFYGFLIVLPVTGYLKLAPLGFEIKVLGIQRLPSMPFDQALAQTAAVWHFWCAILFSIALVLHVLATVFHTRLDGHSVLHRMRLPLGR